MTEKAKERNDAVLECIQQYGPLKTTGITMRTGYGRRDIMYAVRALRMEGYCICSGDDGYWLWDGVDATWDATKMQIKSRLIKMATLYSAMENRPLDGQEIIKDIEESEVRA